jgi:hypothetical protein
MAVIQFLHLHVWIIGMSLANAVAAFTGKIPVLVFDESLVLVRVALLTGFPAGIDGLVGGHFRQRVPAIPAILLE